MIIPSRIMYELEVCSDGTTEAHKRCHQKYARMQKRLPRQYPWRRSRNEADYDDNRKNLPQCDQALNVHLVHSTGVASGRIFAILGRFCKPNPVWFSERSASGFWPDRVKVHTNMCEPKVCSANRNLIFGFIFGSASSDGEATGDVQEDFGGNPVALESQSEKVALARNFGTSFFTLACFARQCGAGLIVNEAAAELFYTRESRKRTVNGKGTKEKEDYLYVDDWWHRLSSPLSLSSSPSTSTNKIQFRLSHDTGRGRDRSRWFPGVRSWRTYRRKLNRRCRARRSPKWWHSWRRDKRSRSWRGVLQSQTAKAHGHMGRLEPASLNRFENFVRFQNPLAERSDGFSRKCAILFRTSHQAAARFRRSFRISVCKTSLFQGSIGSAVGCVRR